jgi:hypothetical protein
MPETDLGKSAVESYSRHLGIPAPDFIKGMSAAQAPLDVAKAPIEFSVDPNAVQGTAFVVSGNGVQAAP